MTYVLAAMIFVWGILVLCDVMGGAAPPHMGRSLNQAEGEVQSWKTCVTFTD